MRISFKALEQKKKKKLNENKCLGKCHSRFTTTGPTRSIAHINTGRHFNRSTKSLLTLSIVVHLKTENVGKIA